MRNAAVVLRNMAIRNGKKAFELFGNSDDFEPTKRNNSGRITYSIVIRR